MSEAVQYEITEMLERAGANRRGNRHDCPKCGGLRTISHTAECFYCHRCQWKGNEVTLARELGLYQLLSRQEYRELQESRERTDRAALALYENVKAQRMELLGWLHDLKRLENAAHDAGPTEVAWEGLAIVSRQRPVVLANLAILENASAADLIKFLSGEYQKREQLVSTVIESGGVYDPNGKFVEV